jgi:hypothetical protein
VETVVAVPEPSSLVVAVATLMIAGGCACLRHGKTKVIGDRSPSSPPVGGSQHG